MVRLKGFEKLTNVDDALKSFLKQLQVKRLDSERVSIYTALGRVTAKDIRARYNLPPFDRSAVDGFALRAKDTFGVSAFNTKTLKLTKKNIQENEAKEIYTGNPLPKGADAIVMLEYTKKIQNKIEITKEVTPGRNISKIGEDVTKGKIAITASTRLTPHHLGLLAGLSETDVDVIKKPQVAIMATGNELVELGKKSDFGKIIETNRLVLSSMCIELGAEPINLGIVKDNLKEIVSEIQKGLKQSDVVITTGGTSVGYSDLVPMAVNEIGMPGIIVHGVALRPGMPTALAILENKPVFVLSGNSVAATVGFEIFARPTILKLLGVNEARPSIEARLTRRVAGALGRRIFLRVRVFEQDGIFQAEPVRVTGSGVLTSMTKANGFVIIPENREGVEEGESVKVHLFSYFEGK